MLGRPFHLSCQWTKLNSLNEFSLCSCHVWIFRSYWVCVCVWGEVEWEAVLVPRGLLGVPQLTLTWEMVCLGPGFLKHGSLLSSISEASLAPFVRWQHLLEKAESSCRWSVMLHVTLQTDPTISIWAGRLRWCVQQCFRWHTVLLNVEWYLRIIIIIDPNRILPLPQETGSI